MKRRQLISKIKWFYLKRRSNHKVHFSSVASKLTLKAFVKRSPRIFKAIMASVEPSLERRLI